MVKARSILAALALLSVIALGAPSASAQVRVQAEISYHESANGAISGVRLQIYRDGYKVLDRSPLRPCPDCELFPVPPSFQDPARVIQLDGSPEPEVIFTLHSGGAHCCIYAQVFRWDEVAARYLPSVHDFRDFGYRLNDLRGNGRPLFVGSDSRLAYRFTCFACASYPPQVWEYRNGEFADVTSSYPRVVKQDLAGVMRSYRRARGRADIRGILATLVADKCLMGNCKAGFKVVRRAIRSGHVRRGEQFVYGPHGPKYLRVLRRFLMRLGYI